MVVLILPYRNVGTFIKRTFFEQKILFQVKSKKRMDNKMKKNSYMNNQKNHADPSMGILVQLGTSTCKSVQQPSKRSNSVNLVLFCTFPIQVGSIWVTVQPQFLWFIYFLYYPLYFCTFSAALLVLKLILPIAVIILFPSEIFQ